MQSPLTGVVLVECTASSESFFQQLQSSLVLEYKLKVVPVGSPQEAAKIIAQMVLVYSGCCANIFHLSSVHTASDTYDNL